MVQSRELLLLAEAGKAYYSILISATEAKAGLSSVPEGEVRVMAKKVAGFLASDGSFFETEAECRRHECAQALIRSCESHGVHPENFFMLLQEWQEQIKGYYDADSKCKVRQVIPTGNVAFQDILSQPQDDNEDNPVGDKDAPAFLQQPFRRNI